MKCNWCDQPATKGGNAPVGTSGMTKLFACERHEYLIGKLRFLEMTEREFRVAERENKEKK